MKKTILFFLIFSLFFSNLSGQYNSVLSSGKWYKISTKSNGIYKLDYSSVLQLGVNVNNLLASNVLKIPICTYNTIMYEYLGKRIPDPLEISTFCDAPVGSGLGSSSTLINNSYNEFSDYLLSNFK